MEWLKDVVSWISAVQYDPVRLRFIFVILLGLVGFTVALTLSLFIGAVFDPLKKRIGAVQGVKQSQYPGVSRTLLQRLGAGLLPKAEEKRVQLSVKLESAGYRSPNAAKLYFGAKLAGFIVVPFLVFAIIAIFSPSQLADWFVLIVLTAVVAFILPDLWLTRAVRRRQKHLRQGLPDALDLLVVCAEAGLGLTSAIKRVAEEIGVQHPELAEELELVIMQTRAGMDNRSALKELERRTGLDDIRAFVTTLVQAMRFGTSIGESLRVFAEDMRDKRLQRAQERAARLSLTMLMPIVLCMLPMFFLIALGPAILSLVRSLANLGGGG